MPKGKFIKSSKTGRIGITYDEGNTVEVLDDKARFIQSKKSGKWGITNDNGNSVEVLDDFDGSSVVPDYVFGNTGNQASLQQQPTPLPSLQEQMGGFAVQPNGTYQTQPVNHELPQANGDIAGMKGIPTASSVATMDAAKTSRDNAIRNTANKKIEALKKSGFAVTPAEVNFYIDQYKQLHDKGDMAVSKDEHGKPVLKETTGIAKSFLNAVNKAAIDRADDVNMSQLDTNGKIKYLEAKRILDEQQNTTVPGSKVMGFDLGAAGELANKGAEFGGENADMLTKTYLGAMTGGALAPEMVGAGHFGGFIATVKDFATGGGQGLVQKTYNDLRQQGVPEHEAMKQAEKTELLGTATGMATGAVLSGMPKLNADKAVVDDFLTHLIKSSGKLGAVSGAESGVNDLGEIGAGVHKSVSDVFEGIGENAARGVGTALAFEALLNIHKVPGALYKMARRVVSSIPEAQRNAVIDNAVETGTLPKEKADEIKKEASEPANEVVDASPNADVKVNENTQSATGAQIKKLEDELKYREGKDELVDGTNDMIKRDIGLLKTDPNKYVDEQVKYHQKWIDDAKNDNGVMFDNENQRENYIKYRQSEIDSLEKIKSENERKPKVNEQSQNIQEPVIKTDERVTGNNEQELSEEEKLYGKKEDRRPQVDLSEPKNIIEPSKPISEMNSEELGSYAKEVKRALAKHDKQFEGKSEDEKEAGGYYDYIDNVSDLREIETRVNYIENAENIHDLTSSAKSALRNIGDTPSEYDLSVLNAVKKRAAELKIDPEDLMKSIVKSVGNDYNDANDAEFMMKRTLEKVFGSAEETKPTLINETAPTPQSNSQTEENINQETAGDIRGNNVEDKAGEETVSEPKPTIAEMHQVNDIHKELTNEYLLKHKELVKQGLRGEELESHPELVAIKEQMAKIEKFFTEKPNSEQPVERSVATDETTELPKADTKVNQENDKVTLEGESKAKTKNETDNTTTTSSHDKAIPEKLGVNTDKIRRSDRTNSIQFTKPIVGKNGNKLLSYTWESNEVAKDKEGKPIRVSDWTKKGVNADTGRDIVHKFKVEVDGKIMEVSADSVAKALGFTDAEMEKAFPKAKDFVKQLAKMKMKEQSLIEQLHSSDDIVKASVNKVEEKHGVKIAVHKDGDNVHPAYVGMPKDTETIGGEDARSLVWSEMRKSGALFTERRNVGDDLMKIRKLINNKKKQATQFGDIEFTENKPENGTSGIITTGSLDKDIPKESSKPKGQESKESVPENIGEAGQGNGEPPTAVLNESGISEPPVNENVSTVITHDDGTVEFSHKGLQKVAEEFGLSDVKKRTRKSDEKLFNDADNTIASWVKEGSYADNIRELISLATKGKISDEERVILEKHLSTLREQANSMDRNSDAYNDKLKQIKELKEAGEKARSEAGAQLRLPTNGGSHPVENLEDAMVVKMQDNGVDKLTDAQKEEVEKLVNKFKEKAEKAEKARAEAEQKYTDFLAEQELAKMKADAESEKQSKGKKANSYKKKTHEDFVSERKSLKEQLQEAKEKHEKWLKDQGIHKAGASPFTLTTDMAKIISKIIRSHFDEGVQVLSDLTKKAFEDVKEIFPEITERDIKDVLIGKYNKRQETKNELQAKWEDIRQEQKLLDELASETAKQPKTESERKIRNQRLYDLRKKIGEKRLAEIETDKHEKKLKDLNDELERVRSRKAKDPVVKGKPKEVSPEEQEVLDKIDAEQEKWDAEKDAARQSAREYQKLETERNRQLEHVEKLKEKLALLKRGQLPESKTTEKKVDTPEIEELKKEIDETEKELKADIAHQDMMDGLETELQRIKDRKEKEKKPESKRVISDEEKQKRDEIEAEQKAWDIEKNIEKLKSELQRVRDRKAKETKPQNRRALTELEKEIVGQLFDEKVAWAKEVEPERKLRQEIKATEKSIADYEHQLAKRIVTTKLSEPGLTSPKLEQLKKRKAELQKQHKKLKDDLGFTDIQKMKNIIRANKKASLKLKQRIAEGKFDPEQKLSLHENFEFKKKYPALYKEAMDSYNEKEEVKKEFDIASAMDKIARENWLQKTYRWFGKLGNTFTAITAGVDDSMAFVQLYLLMPYNPETAFKFRTFTDANGNRKIAIEGAVKEHILDAWDEKRFDREMAKMHHSGVWPLLKASELDVLEPQSLLDKQKEELFQHNLAGYLGVGTIPMGKKLSLGDSQLKRVNAGKFLAMFERAYTSLGNNVRVDLFLQEAKKMYQEGMTIENNLDEFKGLAKVINNLSGRGTIHPKIAPIIPFVRIFIWSPKMAESAINLLGLSDIATGGQAGFYTKLPPRARRYAVRQMAGQFRIAGTVLLAAAMAGYVVHFDPHDKRVGDIEIDENKSVNVFGRYKWLISAIMALWPSWLGGGQLDKKGKRVSVYDEGGKTGGEVIGGAIRGKLNPLAGLGYDYILNDKKSFFSKKPITLSSAATDVATPMSLRDVGKEMERDGTMSLFTYTLPSFVGMPMKDQRDYYANQTGEKDIDNFLQDNKLEIPATTSITHKNKKHPDGNISDKEFDEVIKVKNEKIKQALSKAIKGGLISSDPAKKEHNQEEVEWIEKQSIEWAKDKVLGKKTETIKEQIGGARENARRSIFSVGIFK